MVSIDIDDRGLATLEIEMPGGELISYEPRLVDGGVWLHNLANDEHYCLTPQSPKLWHCDCPAWKYRKSKHAERGCKHASALMSFVKLLCDFRALIEPLLEEPPMPEPTPELDAIVARLAAPFEPKEVRFKPAMVSGNRALALAYVDARVIQDRLDSVLGVSGWQDQYECLPDGSVVCKLSLRLGNEWITKMDVGGESEQKDEGDRRKAAFSDALKRAAVKFAIGRYLYRLPSQWVGYDAQKRQFTQTPTLPGSAIPVAKTSAPATTKTVRGPEQIPTDGIELEQRLSACDQRAVQRGYLEPGQLTTYIIDYARREGGITDSPMPNWPRVVVEGCWTELLRYAEELKAGKKTA